MPKIIIHDIPEEERSHNEDGYEVVAYTEEIDERCDNIINALKKKEITLSEAIDKASKALKEEYSEAMDRLLWFLCVEEKRLLKHKCW